MTGVGLKSGSIVELPQTKRTASVRKLLGEGSQGSVFDIVVEPSGEHRALKWYFPSSGLARQRAAIDQLVERGSPDRRFLWPTEIAVIHGEASFGYVMPLRDPTSVSLADLLTGKVDVTLSTVCALGMELADTFLQLHSQGLCYRDISFGNIFFDPQSGRPLICDTDNVGVDGASTSAVLGTRRFMAPEIVRREASPSTVTDLYSLAVLLFYILMVGHPLVGRRELEFGVWDDHAESVLFGTDPRFVFHPSDESNAPLPELHNSMIVNWAMYPDVIRRLFVQAFTVGLTDPDNGRVRESVWRSALSRLRDLIVRCAACSKENFWRSELHDSHCWSCDRVIPDPVRLNIGGRPLVLNDGTALCRHHLLLDYHFDRVVARVTRHPVHVERWGLRNETNEAWQVTLPNGERIVAEPSRSVGLLPGTTILIGRTLVTITT